jgi:uncharacterized protein (TIGR02453 family)
MDQLPPFPGFRPEGLQFLRDLAAHNEREWFKARKQTFEDELIWPLRCLVADLSRAAGLPLQGDPAKSLFRIYRDVRFSKNKEPYKKHVAAVLSRSGSRKAMGGLYIHVEPDNCFVAGGFWKPDKTLLGEWRDGMVRDPDAFREIMADLNASDFELLTHGGVLKRLPRGYESVSDPDVSAYLKQKSFLVSRPFTERELELPGFTASAIKAARQMLPLLHWGWRMQDSSGA